MIHAVSSEERERLLAEFIRLCEIESPSGRERAVAQALMEELRGLGIEVEEDDTASQTGSDSGNLLARVPGPEGSPTVLLCAHMDTVPLDGPVEVVSDNGLLTNRHDAILGADNKAAVVTILGAVRRLVRDGTPPAGIEVLFTTGEEQALKGAKSVDMSRLNADYGYVFDHASPIGEIVIASPTYYSVEARFRGQAAHAGIRPEAGHNAIAAAARAIAALRIGRLDPGDDGERGPHPRRHVGERGRRALLRRARDAQPRRRQGGRGRERDGRRAERGRERLGVRRGDLGRAPVPGLPAAAHGARRGGGRGGAAGQRDRAVLHTDGRRQRRERLHPGRARRS